MTAVDAKRGLWTCAVALVVAILTPQEAMAQCQYEVTILPELDCGIIGSGPAFPGALNSAGQALLGTLSCGPGYDEAYFWEPGDPALTPLPLPPGIDEVAGYDLSEDGLIVGGVGGPAGSFGFVFDTKTWEYTVLLAPLDANGWCVIESISPNGRLCCGFRSLNDGGDPVNPYTAFVYDIATGKVTDLGLVNGYSTSAADVNDTGFVCGTWAPQYAVSTPFIWDIDTGQVTDLGTLAGLESWSIAMNSANQIVGRSAIPMKGQPYGVLHAFSWRDGVMMDLGTLPGDHRSTVNNLNDQSIAIGRSLSLDGLGDRAVVWYGSAIYDLAELVIPSGYEFWSVRGLDPFGRMMAHGRTPNGDFITAILNPQPPLADVNADCLVNVDDLLKVIHEWGWAQSDADINSSGAVDVFDLVLVLENWTLY